MTLDLEIRGRTAVLTMNQPAAMNAMDPETYRGLSEAWIEARDNPDIGAAILRRYHDGTGRPSSWTK